MKRILGLTFTIIALVFTLTACGGGTTLSGVGGDTRDSAPSSGGAPLAPMPASDVGEASKERQVTRQASVVLRVADTKEAAASIRTLATQTGGWVTWEEMYDASSTSTPYSMITVQVPSSKLEQTLDALAGLGTVESRTISSADVTAEVVDVESRIKTMRESIARLNALMEKATKISDIAAIEGELAQRQAELESLLAQQKWLTSQVEMAPIQVTLVTKGAEYRQPNPFVEGFRQGWAAFIESIRVLIVFVAALLPFGIVAAAIVIPILRIRRHRKAKAKLPGATAAPTETPGATPPVEPPIEQGDS